MTPIPHLFSSLVALGIIGLIMMAAVLIPWWMIWKKAGFSPWLSLLVLVPVVNFIMLYVLAFADWRVVPADRVTLMPPPRV